MHFWIERFGDRIDNALEYALVLAKTYLPASLLDEDLPVRHRGDGSMETLLTPERWGEIISDSYKRSDGRTAQFKEIIRAAVRNELRARGDNLDFTDPRVIEVQAVVASAPDYIRDSGLSLQDQLDIFRIADDVSDDLAAGVEEAKRLTIESLQSRDTALHGDGPGIEAIREVPQIMDRFSSMTRSVAGAPARTALEVGRTGCGDRRSVDDIPDVRVR